MKRAVLLPSALSLLLVLTAFALSGWHQERQRTRLFVEQIKELNEAVQAAEQETAGLRERFAADRREFYEQKTELEQRAREARVPATIGGRLTAGAENREEGMRALYDYRRGARLQIEGLEERAAALDTLYVSTLTRLRFAQSLLSAQDRQIDALNARLAASTAQESMSSSRWASPSRDGWTP